MGSTYIVCCVLAIALNQHVVVEGAVCANDITRASCSWDAVVSTQAACNGLAGGRCNWCLTPTPMPVTRRCQTDNFACLVASPTIISTGTSLTTCTAAVGIYCSGDTTQKCICDEPLLGLCYKPGPVTACSTTHATQVLCDADVGCFWCGQGIASRINNCYAIPDGALSCQTGSCCNKLNCASTVTAPTCTVGYKPCIWDGVTTTSLTEQGCHEFNKHCAWCPSGQDSIRKRCQTVDRSCLVADQWVIPAGTTAALCTAEGGIHCHGDCAKTCIYPEPADKICFKPGGITGASCADTTATTAVDCRTAGCVWCDGTGVLVRRDKCWAMPPGTTCATGTLPTINCCMKHRCMDGNDFLDLTCTDLGCQVCTPTAPAGPKLCVYPLVP